MEGCFNILVVVIQSLQNVLNTGVHGQLVSVLNYYNGFIQRALLTKKILLIFSRFISEWESHYRTII